MPKAPFTDLLLYLRKVCGTLDARDKSDAELVERFRANRDEAAFSALVRRHGPMVLGVCRRVLGNSLDAEDAFQAAFVVLVRRAGSIGRAESVGSWLHAVAQRVATKARNKETGRRQRERRYQPMPTTDVLDDLTWDELRVVLDEEIARLPKKCRAPIVLCYLEGRSYEQAALELGLPKTSLRRLLDRARERLRQNLVRRGITLSAGVLATALAEKAGAVPVAAMLTINTVKAATTIAAGNVAAASCVSAKALALAEEAMTGMVGFKTTVVVMMLALSLAVGGAGLAGCGALTQAKPSAQQEKPPAGVLKTELAQELPPVATDRYGDPLPRGAINRIGSLTFRPAGRVSHLLYLPDGKALASISSDRVVQLWDVATGKPRWRYDFARSINNYAFACSPDGKILALLTDLEFALIAVDTGKVLRSKEWTKADGDDLVRSVAISPDLRTFARGYWDSTVRLFDAATYDEKKRFTVSNEKAFIPMVIRLSSDGKTVFVANDSKPNFLAFNASTGQRLPIFGDDEISRRRFVLSPNDRMLAFVYRDSKAKGGDRVVLWDLQTGKQLREFELPQPASATFSPDSALLAIRSDREIVFVDTETCKIRDHLVGEASGPMGLKHALAFAPDGKTIAGTDASGCIIRAEVPSGKLLPPMPEPRGNLRDLHFIDGGKELRAGTGSSFGWWDVRKGSGFGWWNVTTGEQTRATSPNPVLESTLGLLSPDGKTMTAWVGHAGANNPGQIDKATLLLVDAATAQTLHTLAEYKENLKDFEPFAEFSPDSTRLFSNGHSHGSVLVWDVATGKLDYELSTDTKIGIQGVTVSPGGQWLAAYGSLSGKGSVNEILLWNIPERKLLHRLPAKVRQTFTVKFTADGSQLFSSGIAGIAKGESSAVQVWDVATGKEMSRIGKYDGMVGSLAITPDGRMLAVAARDSLRLWEIATREERATIQGHEDSVDSLDFSPDSRLLAVSSRDARVLIWDVYNLTGAKPPAAQLAKTDRDALWQRLADNDAAKSFQAMCALITRPAEAVGILENGWKQLPRTTSKQMQKWVQDLDSEQFAVRQAATAELDRFAFGHLELLRDSLKGAANLEVRQRLQQILDKPDVQRLRTLRMLEVLERLGTPQARQFLQALASQADDAALSRDAGASLARLEKR